MSSIVSDCAIVGGPTGSFAAEILGVSGTRSLDFGHQRLKTALVTLW